MNIKMTRTALLGSGGAFIVAMAAMPGFADESLAQRRAEMQEQIQKLEARLNALEAKRARDRRVRRRVAAAAASVRVPPPARELR